MLWLIQTSFYPLIVKPTDSAGSKGVTRVDKEEDLKEALEYAFKHSIKGNIIVEEFIEKQGCSSDSDSFSVNGCFSLFHSLPSVSMKMQQGLSSLLHIHGLRP